MKEQIGIKFNLQTDWKALFQKDTWFEWRRSYERDGIFLRRFTIFNVIKWYCFQIIIRVMVLIVKPIINLSHIYYTDWTQGTYYKFIAIEILRSMPKIKFFRLGKE